MRCKACNKVIEDCPLDDAYELCNQCFNEVLNDLNDDDVPVKRFVKNEKKE